MESSTERFSRTVVDGAGFSAESRASSCIDWYGEQPQRLRTECSDFTCSCSAWRESRRRLIDVKYVGMDIPNEFVVGYGLDYAEKYRNLDCVGTLAPHIYE